MTDGIKKIVAVVALAAGAIAYLHSPLSSQGQSRPGTAGNTPLSRWRPTRELPGVSYVGSATCAQCHTYHVSKHSSTPMARAMQSPADCDILIKNPRLTFRSAPYSYQVTRQGETSIYTVSDGVRAISEPILFCFGQGVAGQTYIFRRNGALYESRVSYYSELNNLDFTIQHPRSAPPTLEDAIGRPMNEESAKGCFGCHSTAAASETKFQPEHRTPGVSCEGCHGPGEKHVAAVKGKNFKDLQIFHPGKLDALELSQEFCGACHMSFEKVMEMPKRGGALNVRFQPYRILNSSKHLINDHRLSCVACHDPHDKLEHNATFYDSKCLSCHLSEQKEAKTQERSASACPISKRDCATCHMPKIELPETHFKFTDHWIRIVKPGAPVPN